MKQDNQIVLSFYDIWQGMRQARWLVLISALFFGTLLFAYLLMKPPTFTAEGTFKGGAQEKGSGISKALELLGGGESYSSNDDPKVFLKSYPVMEDVARTLHLQLNITEKKRSNQLARIWRTLKAERAQRHAKSRRPASPILNVPVASKMAFPDNETPIECIELEYPALVSVSLSINFLNETQFRVVKKKQVIGEGELGQPFIWDGGVFTLAASESVAGKGFLLTFIPLEAAAKSLEKSLTVMRSKDNKSLIHLSFTHPDRHLAAAIVNTTMDAFRRYLSAEGKRKISKQMSYLRQRQDESIGGLENVLDEYKSFLESHLDSGELFMLETELQYMAEQQMKARNNLDVVSSEMMALHKILAGTEAEAFPQLLEKLRKKRPSKEFTLTVDGARGLLREQEQTIERIQLEQEHYDYCLTKLSEPDFDTSSLSKLIDDPTLKSRFEKIHNLHRNLIDEKNWTVREREQLQEELATERRFLVKHLNHLKEGAGLKDQVLRGHIRDLQKTMLYLLLDRYDGVEKGLKNIALKAAHFPQKWLTEQKIELNTKLQMEMIESITKIIESKNIGYHLDYIGCTPLASASLPVIPNSPHLLFGFLVGSFLGIFLVLGGVTFCEVWLGPSASYANLKSEGRQAISFSHTMDELKHAHYHLKSYGKVLTLVVTNPAIAYDIASLFEKSGENVLLIDLSKKASEDTFLETSYGQLLTLGAPDNLKEITLGSRRFEELLCEQKAKFDRILLTSTAPLSTLEVRLLLDFAEGAMLVISEERWKALPKQLPEKTLYLAEAIAKRPLSLKEIVPFLERVTSLSFSSSEHKSSQEPQQTETSPF